MNSFDLFLLWLEQHEKLAGWAQFAGAMLALGATFLAAWLPVWAQRQDQRRRQKRLREAASNAASAAYAGISTVAEFVQTDAHIEQIAEAGFPDHVWKIGLRALQEFPLNELDDVGVIQNMRILATLAEGMGGFCSDAQKYAQLGSFDPRFQQLATEREAQAKHIRDEITKAI
jgi:hypothetical protein